MAVYITIIFKTRNFTLEEPVDIDKYSAIDLVDDCIETLRKKSKSGIPKRPKFYYKHPKSRKSIEIGCDRTLMKMFEVYGSEGKITVTVVDGAHESDLWKLYTAWTKDADKRATVSEMHKDINNEEFGDDQSDSLFSKDDDVAVNNQEQEIISPSSPPMTLPSQPDVQPASHLVEETHQEMPELNQEVVAPPPVADDTLNDTAPTSQAPSSKGSRRKKKPRGLNLTRGTSVTQSLHRVQSQQPEIESPVGTFTAPLQSSQQNDTEPPSVGDNVVADTRASATVELQLATTNVTEKEKTPETNKYSANEHSEPEEFNEEDIPYFSDDSWHKQSDDDQDVELFDEDETGSEGLEMSEEDDEVDLEELEGHKEGGEFSGDEEEGIKAGEPYLFGGKPFERQNDGNIRLEPKQMFLNKRHFLDVIQDYAVQEGVDLHRVANDPQKYTVRCNNMDTCPWRLHASRLVDKLTFMIKTIKGEHTCARLSENPMATQAWITRKIIPELRANASMSTKSLQELILSRYGATVAYMKTFRAKKDALQFISGNHADSYGKLHQYAKIALERNPGSIIDLKYQEYLNGPPTFSKMFICFAAMKDGFLKGCRPFLGVDGCHLKGPYGGVLLSAVAIDGNNGIFPVAYAVVQSETIETWTYFFSNLAMIAPEEVRRKWVIISDRQKGVEPALETVMPEATRRICCRHLYANFKKENPGTLLRNLFWEAAQCYTNATLRDALQKLGQASASALAYVRNVDYDLWVRLHMSSDVKVIEITSNFVESFNSKLSGIRGSPIFTMLEQLRRNLMKKMNGRREAINKMNGTVTPYVQKVLYKNVKAGRHCGFTGSSEWEYEVTDFERHYIVNLRDRHCDCMGWDLSGIPCKHACVVLNYKRIDKEPFVDPYFSMAKYAETYANAIAPIPDPNNWPEASGIRLAPPFFKKLPGRPKKNRRREQDEAAAKGKRSSHITCKVCLQIGHNKRTCNSKTNRGAGQGSGLELASEGGTGNGAVVSGLPAVEGTTGNRERKQKRGRPSKSTATAASKGKKLKQTKLHLKKAEKEDSSLVGSTSRK